MNEFILYLRTGLEHILDKNGYDHILFVVALCAVYDFSRWRNLLVLVTAFTLGHSITLALATFKVITVNALVIEFLIPMSILCTCIANFFYFPPERKTKHGSASSFKGFVRYTFATGFGLIHGMGFSNFLSALLGKQTLLTIPLLAFNIGLEIGQLAIVFITLLFSFIFVEVFQTKSREWNLILSGLVAGVSLTLLADKWIF